MRSMGSAGGRFVCGAAVVALVAVGAWLAAYAAGPARAAAPPKEERDPPKPRSDPRAGIAQSQTTDSDSTAPALQPVRPIPRDEPLPEIYRGLVRGMATRSRSDTIGTGLFLQAKEAFHRGDFERAATLAKEFTDRHLRNLNMNDALELTLLLREYRDFHDEPLRIYARALGLREAGAADSAVAEITKGLEQYPGAKIRHHWRFLLSELAFARGDYAAAVVHARAVADTTTGSRLAPYALRLAGDATLESGAGPAKASPYYQELLLRFPDSPLAPGTRATLLALRKGMQL